MQILLSPGIIFDGGHVGCKYIAGSRSEEPVKDHDFALASHAGML
jgi:hypothetical protein